MTKIYGKLRRYGFPTTKKLPRAAGWPQKHQALLKTKSYLYNVRSLEVNFSKKGPGNAGARFFVYFELPSLKFWNPDISFLDRKILGPKPELPNIVLEMMNGTTVPISITPAMRQADILAAVLSVCGPKAFPKLPTPNDLVRQTEEYKARKASAPKQAQQETIEEQPQEQTQEQTHKQYEKPKRKVTEVKVTDS